MNVLAIEDQAIAGLQLMATLRALGHEAELTTDGAAAMQRLEAGGFRVVVSDWRMPGMDGLDFCRRLRQRQGDYIYFILISATPVTKSSRETALGAGVDDFLVKPVDPDELGMRLHVAERIIQFTTQVKTLESILPICGYCKKIRTDQKYWQELEAYFGERGGTQFSHGICPDCYEKRMVPELQKLGIDTSKLPPLERPGAPSQ
jgi:DNA-binding response OmpR family regulator